jgi:hypothetical protein
MDHLMIAITPPFGNNTPQYDRIAAGGGGINLVIYKVKFPVVRTMYIAIFNPRDMTSAFDIMAG